MRFNININQVKALEWGLNMSESGIFVVLYDAPNWAEKAMIDGDVYYFVSRNLIKKELPLLGLKSDTIYRYAKNLEKKGLIRITKIGKKDYVLITEKGKEWNKADESEARKIIRLRENNTDNSEKNPNNVGKKSDSNSEKNPTYNTYNIDNNNNIDNVTRDNVEKQVFDDYSSSQNESLFDSESLKVEEKEKKETGAQKKEKEIISEVIDYLNEKIDRTLRKDSTAAKQIWHRFKNGATVEEMKKVIDDKVSEWKGTHMEKYLHPSTLFLKSNYEKYIEQMPEKKSGSDEQLIAMFKSPVEEIIKKNGFVQVWDNYQEKSMIEFGRKISESIKGNGGKGTFEEIIEMIGAVIGNLPDFHKQNFSMDYLNKNYSKIINSIKHGGKKGRRETDRIKQALKATRNDAFGGHFKNFHKY